MKLSTHARRPMSVEQPGYNLLRNCIEGKYAPALDTHSEGKTPGENQKDRGFAQLQVTVQWLAVGIVSYHSVRYDNYHDSYTLI